MPQPPTDHAATCCIAITGASGFIGRHLVRKLAARGQRVRVLARSDPTRLPWGDVDLEVIPGSLADPGALERLVDGADAVLHLAGLIKAAGTAEFMSANRDGTRALAETVERRAPSAHFIQVSSLAAREPQLSAYAASKRAGEDLALAILGDHASVLRPPAVYGPGDRETLVFFKLAARNPVWLLGVERARTALIHVEDLAEALAGLASARPSGGVHEIADAHPGGYRWEEIMYAAAIAVGNRVPRLRKLPNIALRTVAACGDLGQRLGLVNMLNSEKLRELLHENWSVDAQGQPPQLQSWRPRFSLEEGFRSAVRWYRDEGWL